MSKRRKVGDWVHMTPVTGFIIGSEKYKAQIQEGYDPCFTCEDPECKEWYTLFSEERPEGRIPFYHVSECDMLDSPFKEDDDDS